MVFHNIVELCIIQIRPELWPRTVLRKITDPLPFLARGAHGSSLSAWNHKEETEHFTQNIIVKQWHKGSFQETSPAANLGEVGAERLNRVKGSGQGLGSETVGWICKSGFKRAVRNN